MELVRKSITATFLLAVLSISSIANAAFVVADFEYTGDQALIRDTDTGLEWLVLGYTKGFSYDYVSSGFSDPGSAFFGWQYADTGQVSQFFDNAGGSGTYTGLNPAHNPVASDLLSLWGSLYAIPGYSSSSHFITAESTDVDRHNTGIIVDYETGSDLIALSYSDILNNASNVSMGSALIRVSGSVSSVPIPAAAWLFGSGLIALIGVARRKQALYKF